jgi:hypothetical protein
MRRFSSARCSCQSPRPTSTGRSTATTSVGATLILGSALIYLFRDDNTSRRTVRALTVRITLSVSLFILLIVAHAMGLIQPGALGR